MSSKIIRALFGFHPFAALHWRYNKNDFLRHCPGNSHASQLSFTVSFFEGWEACKVYEAVTADIENFCDTIEIELQSHNINSIYLAAPPNEIEFISKLSEILIDRGFKVMTMKDSLHQMQKLYPHCEYIRQGYQRVFKRFDIFHIWYHDKENMKMMFFR